MNSLILKALENIPEIKPGTDLVDLILHNISNEEIILQNGDIFVIAQKIVSKSETVSYTHLTLPTKRIV